MTSLAETIAKFGAAMRELGQAETIFHGETDNEHKEVLRKSLERAAVRVAEAKLALLSAKATNGKSLANWGEECPDSFFESALTGLIKGEPHISVPAKREERVS